MHSETGAYEIGPDDLSGEATRALVRLHFEGMHRETPAGHVFALDLPGLVAPGVTLFSARVGDAIAGIAALKELPEGDGELKSMRTHPNFLRHGVGMALLDHLIAEARRRGISKLYLETGRGPAFDPALALYRRRGFVACGAFGAYEQSAFNQFMVLALSSR